MKRAFACQAFAVCWLVIAMGIVPRLEAAPASRERPLAITLVLARPAGSDSSIDAVNSAVAKPIASVMSGLRGAACVETISTLDRCTVVVHFGNGARPPEALQAVHQGLTLPAAKLPAGWVVSQTFPDSVPRIWVALSSEQLDLVELTKIAERLGRDHFDPLPGVMNIRVIGAARQAFVLKLDPAKMASFAILVEDVQRALAGATQSVDGKAAATAPSDWGSTLIKTANNVPIFLRDVARLDSRMWRSGSAMAGDRAAVVLAISATATEPALQTIKPQLAQLAGELPAGVRMDVADLSGGKAALVEIAAPADLSEAAGLEWEHRVTERVSAAASGAICIGYSSDDISEPFRVLIARDDGPVELGGIRKGLLEIPHQRAWAGTVEERQFAAFPIQFALVGPDSDLLKRWADATSARVKSDGIAPDVGLFPTAQSPVIKYEVDKSAATKNGISLDAIDHALATLAGTTVTLPDHLTAVLKWPTSDTNALGSLYVKSASGDVPLAAVVRVVSEPRPSAICTVGGRPALRITAYPPFGSTPDMAATKCLAAANAARDQLKLPHDFRAISLTEPAP